MAELLKRETCAEHALVEMLVTRLDPGASRATYRAYLQALYGVYAPLEARLAQAGERLFGSRTAWLEEDLCGLGHDRGSLALLARARAPMLATRAHALGARYVLEGSALGGRVLERRFRSQLAGAAGDHFRFLHGPGDDTGPRWRAFLQILTAFGDAQDALGRHALVVGARTTFGVFSSCFQQVSEPLKPCGTGGGP